MDVRRGDIYFADLAGWSGSEQGGVRPVLIVQNDVGNQYSPTTIAAAITSRINKAKLPTHVEIDNEQCSLRQQSIVLCEQIRTLDKKRLGQFIANVGDKQMTEVDNAIAISLGIASYAGS